MPWHAYMYAMLHHDSNENSDLTHTRAWRSRGADVARGLLLLHTSYNCTCMESWPYTAVWAAKEATALEAAFAEDAMEDDENMLHMFDTLL